jgi:hypothetical protein
VASPSFVVVLVALVAVVILAPSAHADPTWVAPGDLGDEVAGTSSIGQVAVALDGTAVV